MSNTNVTPRLGAFVLYTLSEMDEREIRQARIAAGTSTRRGNDALEGQTYPATVVRDWDTSQNLQVFLDGTDTHWVTSRSEFNPERDGAYAKDAPKLVLAGWDEYTPPDEIAKIEASNRQDELTHRATWWRPDPRGHWRFPEATPREPGSPHPA